MTNREIFIETVEALFSHSTNAIPQAAVDYFEALKATEVKEKPAFTQKGAEILVWMQNNYQDYNNVMKAKEIGEGMFITSRAVSGSIRKLIADKYVEKIAGSPICYSLTEAGKTCSVVFPESKEETD